MADKIINLFVHYLKHLLMNHLMLFSALKNRIWILSLCICVVGTTYGAILAAPPDDCKRPSDICSQIEALGTKLSEKTDLKKLRDANVSDEILRNLLKTIDSWTTVTAKKKFITDFAQNVSFRNGIEEDPNLIHIWIKVNRLPTYAVNIKFLKNLKSVIDNVPLRKHVFMGDFKVDVSNLTAPIFDISGLHHHAAFTTRTSNFQNFDARFKSPPSKVNDKDRRYQGKAEVFHADYIKTNPKSPTAGWKASPQKTFFPTTWTVDDTLEEMALALTNKTNRESTVQPNPAGGSREIVQYTGLCSAGFNLVIIEVNNILTTIYPTWP
ncbi:MAG: hypothetical protein RL329_1366 [Bacteroidota bacterium]